MIPLLQISSDGGTISKYAEDLDLLLEGDSSGWAEQGLGRISAVASRDYVPRLFGAGNTDFQFTRGLLGVSM